MRILIIFFLILITYIPAYAFIFEVTSVHPDTGMDYINFGIYDSNGTYSGYNATDPKHKIINLNGFDTGSHWVGDEFAPAIEVSNFLYGRLPDGTSGNYKLAIYTTKLKIYQIDGWMMERTVDMGYFTIKGIIDVGQVKYWEIKYTPMQNPVITRIATSSDLIADITTAQKLNLIGNAKFVTEITKEINEIEAKRTKVDPSHGSGDDGLTPAQKAKKEYQELLKEITEKYNKPEADEFIKQEAYTVLKEDLEYIISHIQ